MHTGAAVQEVGAGAGVPTALGLARSRRRAEKMRAAAIRLQAPSLRSRFLRLVKSATKIATTWRGYRVQAKTPVGVLLSRMRLKSKALTYLTKYQTLHMGMCDHVAGRSGLLYGGHPFTLESVCSPGMYCARGIDETAQLELWEPSAKEPLKFILVPSKAPGGPICSFWVGSRANCMNFDLKVFSEGGGEYPFVGCAQFHQNGIRNGKSVSAHKAACSTWRLCTMPNSTIGFTIHDGYLNGEHLNVSGGGKSNGTKVQVWSTTCDHSRWQFHFTV